MRTNFSPWFRIFDVHLCRIIKYNIHEFVEALGNKYIVSQRFVDKQVQ